MQDEEEPAQGFANIALAAAEKGRDAIISGSASRQPISKGAPGDVFTAVDRHVETVIRDFLTAIRPDDRIVGEELPDSGGAASGIEWYLDPIDGTANFVLGLGLYCTSVAAYDRDTDTWLGGAVTLPGGAGYVAARGRGAFKIDPGGTITPIHARIADGAPRLLGVGFSYDPAIRADELGDIAGRMAGYDDLRSLGTATYALCLIAEGVLAGFIETDLYVYDWAAGALIAEEAGAAVHRPGLGRGTITAFGATSLRPRETST